jgi:hypothetical protein
MVAAQCSRTITENTFVGITEVQLFRYTYSLYLDFWTSDVVMKCNEIVSSFWYD